MSRQFTRYAVLGGDGVFGADKKAATEGTCLLFGPGDSVTFTAGSASGCDFLLLAGVPLREPRRAAGSATPGLCVAGEDGRTWRCDQVPAHGQSRAYRLWHLSED